MRQTTSQRTLRKKRTSKAQAAICLLTAVGCQQAASPVYVDLSSVPVRHTSRLVPTELTTGPALSSENSVPDLEARDMFIGSAEDRAREALEYYKNAQDEAVAGVLARLERAYVVEVSQGLKDRRSAIQEEYALKTQEEIALLRKEFEEHSRVVGALRNDLTGLVGFPDPDPKSIRVPPSHDKVATDKFLKAKEIRLAIHVAGSEYKRTVETRLRALEDQRAVAMKVLEEEATKERSDALKRAEKEARAISEQAESVLERTALSPETRLPAVKGSQSSVDSRPVTPQPFVRSSPLSESPEAIREQLDVWLRVMNYRLVDRPSKGRDATEEFVQWRQKYIAGR